MQKMPLLTVQIQSQCKFSLQFWEDWGKGRSGKRKQMRFGDWPLENRSWQVNSSIPGSNQAHIGMKSMGGPGLWVFWADAITHLLQNPVGAQEYRLVLRLCRGRLVRKGRVHSLVKQIMIQSRTLAPIEKPANLVFQMD